MRKAFGILEAAELDDCGIHQLRNHVPTLTSPHAMLVFRPCDDLAALRSKPHFNTELMRGAPFSNQREEYTRHVLVTFSDWASGESSPKSEAEGRSLSA